MPPTKPSRVPPPTGVWSEEGNAARARSETDEAVAAGLRALAQAPSHSFRRDVLAYCALRDLVPHPKLLPPHVDEEEARGADDAASLALGSGSTGNVYDLSDVDRVDVRHWRLDDGNCRALSFALPLATRLRSLCLFNAGLGPEQLALVCRAVPHSHLQSLQLDWNPVPPAPTREPEADGSGAQAQSEATEIDDCVFADALGDGSRLVVLSLRANGVTARGAAALAQRLRTNATLEALNLFDNRLGDDGAVGLARALHANATLRTLSLANNDISGRGLRALTEAVTKYEAPQELHDLLHAAESRILAQIAEAKKAKKKLDRPGAIAALGLPVLEPDGDSGRWLAPGNATLQELVLSGNARISERDLADASALLDTHADKLRAHLRRVKLHRLAVSPGSRDQPLSEFLCV